MASKPNARQAADPEQQAVRLAWGATVARALRERNISVNTAAIKIGVGHNTLATWLRGDNDPDIRTFHHLAELSGLSHALLLELAGVLPAELGSVAYQLHAARELGDGLQRLKQWVDQAIDISDTPPAAQVASTLLSRSKDWAVSIRPALRGRRYRILQHTYFGVESLHLDALSVEQARAELHRLISDLYAPYGLTWREQAAHDYDRHPSLLLQVPDHERPRAPSAPDFAAPSTVLVIGLPYAHAEFLGSFIAHALGYGYADLRYGPEAPGALTSEEARIDAMVRHAQQLLARPPQRHVWSLADHRVLQRLGDDLRRAPVPLVVVVEPGPVLRARGCEVWNVPAAEMRELHEHLRRIITAPPWPMIHIPIDDNDLLVGGLVDRDLLVDAMVQASLRALTRLFRSHGGPPPALWHELPGGAPAAEVPD
jgi:transcriptional regulator with XRE-family HTH domain